MSGRYSPSSGNVWTVKLCCMALEKLTLSWKLDINLYEAGTAYPSWTPVFTPVFGGVHVLLLIFLLFRVLFFFVGLSILDCPFDFLQRLFDHNYEVNVKWHIPGGHVHINLTKSVDRKKAQTCCNSLTIEYISPEQDLNSQR